MTIKSEIESKADFSIIRYAQVWEDADILLEGLNIQPGDVCLSIASAGDNALAMLASNPEKVIAIDLNLAQLFCLELRVAAYKALQHQELLELMGSADSKNRVQYYQRCRKLLTAEARTYWDGKQGAIHQHGIGGLGKFEQYFRLFKNWILPLVHSKGDVEQLFESKPKKERAIFYDRVWNSWRWRLLIRIFFSRTLMGKLGRDPAFFNYVEGSFSDHVFEKIRQGMRSLNAAENPYLQWILQGLHGTALPFSLRYENFETIRDNLDKLEWHLLSTEVFAERCQRDNIRIDKHNLSNIFEYMSEDNYLSSMQTLINISNTGARLLYWNMMVSRSCPDRLKHRLAPQEQLARRLHCKDKAIFYNNLVIEDVV